MGLNIVAEGVETDAQMQALIQKGCGVMQGYLFSKPLAPAQLTEFLGAISRRTFSARNAGRDGSSVWLPP